MASAENVYKFIDECLKVIRKEGPLPVDFTKKPDLADIQTIEPAVRVLPAGVDAANISDNETIKTALKELLPVIGYENKDPSKNPIFIKKFDSKMPAAAAKPAKGYWAINIETGNAWEIDQYKPVSPSYGGKKRKTNRRKHRSSNRKTLGRKK
jgi:hypothetical protein